MITTKERICVRLRPETIQQIKDFANKTECCSSRFIENLATIQIDNYSDVSYDRHQRKAFCVRIEKSVIEALRFESRINDVSLESLFEAKLKRFETYL